eukprot:Amastigsp_a509431_131.p1 type:complete len:276 gc:universal Amastigsp_a509431_131:854-27(-)
MAQAQLNLIDGRESRSKPALLVKMMTPKALPGRTWQDLARLGSARFGSTVRLGSLLSVSLAALRTARPATMRGLLRRPQGQLPLGRRCESRVRRDVARDLLEKFLDVLLRLGARLDVQPADGARKRQRVFARDLAPIHEIDLVASKNKNAPGRRDRPRVRVPARRERLERRLVCHIEDENDAMRVAIERANDGPEPILTRRVPDLQLDRFLAHNNVPDLEINTDRRLERRPELLAAVPQKQVALADARVTHNHNLVQPVVAVAFFRNVPVSSHWV